ncbi:hypothetical protein L2U69_11910 [Zavarzinia compransoris]|uniref:hypothetical protein n=1 Tax=Zavarzinia marina TaxID=2911065 RepID=UPI001F3CDF1F|nr:hypothetical protein [Zavarzinia marina]MCF4166352.1 hypothetical protein [Zavarzinia marina]
MSSKRTPWLKWYPSDWRADPALRMCSFAAQGLWVAVLGVMHEAEPYGHLLVNGRAPTTRQLTGLLGGAEREIAALLQELEEAGVFSRDDEGVIYSRRMVRDKAKADADRENGKRGGNPKLSHSGKASDRASGKPRGKTNGKTVGVNPPSNPMVDKEDKAHIPEARDIPSQGRSFLGWDISQTSQDRATPDACPFDRETGEVS